MQQQFFSTAELPLAAGIMCHGFPLDHLATDKHQARNLFVFLSEPEVLKLVQDFWQRRMVVNVQTFYENLKFLKARLRNGTPETKD